MVGILFPLTGKGDRSTTVFNKAVYKAMAESLGSRSVAQAIDSEKDWRHKYHACVDLLIEGLVTTALKDSSAFATALRAGLEQARAMDFEAVEGSSVPLAQAMTNPGFRFHAIKVQGHGQAKTEFVLPYDNSELRGEAVGVQCDLWVQRGTMESDCAAAIKAGAQKLEGLSGRTFLVLGAGSELGPVKPLLEAGATVAAVATNRPQRWSSLIQFARSTAGTLLVPLAAPQFSGNDEELAQAAGADLLSQAPAVAEWLVRCGKEALGPVTFCTYLYADGEANVRLTAAADFVAEAVAQALGKQKVSFAYLASPSTSVVMPEAAAQAQAELYSKAGIWAKTFGHRRPCKAVEGTPMPVHLFNGFEVLQGPNYALAQGMRQWRAMLLHMEGFIVSTPMAPICRTESVVHNPTMAVVLEGMAYWQPMEAFDADTARMALLAILLSDLEEPAPDLASPMHLFTRKAFHSGSWRCPFDLASLGMSTWLLGKLAPRRRP